MPSNITYSQMLGIGTWTSLAVHYSAYTILLHMKNLSLHTAHCFQKDTGSLAQGWTLPTFWHSEPSTTGPYLVSTIFSEFLLYWLSCLESSCFSLGPDHRNKTNWPKVNFSLLSGTWNQNSQWLLCFRTFAFAILLLGMLFPQILSGYLFFQVSAPQHPRSPYHKWHVPALLHLCLLLSFILLYFLFNIYHDLTQPIYKIALFYFLPFPTRMWAPWE